MFKKVFSIVMCLSFVLSISAFTTFYASAASHPKWEIVQDYETNGAEAFNVDVDMHGIGNEAQNRKLLAEGKYATNGLVSMQLNSNGLTQGTDGWDFGKNPFCADVISKDNKPATIANPSGAFVRVETTAQAGCLWLPFPDGASWGNFGTHASEAYQLIFVTDSGTIYHVTDFKLPVANFLGYVFIAFKDMTAGKVKNLGFYEGDHNGVVNIPWLNAITLFDNVGYYSVSSISADNEYKDIVNSLNTEMPLNPESLESISTGNYNNSVLSNAPMQMKSIKFHASSLYVWSVSDSSVATIDASGVLTPKKIGAVDVTYSNPTKPELTKTITANVVFGFVTITCKDNDSTDKAVFGIKFRLRGVPTFLMPDTNVKWSVVSGPATITDIPVDLKDLDKDLVNAANPSAAMVSFTGSGKVVVRASYVVDPAVYSDYIFNVAPNLNLLAQSILVAQNYSSNDYTSASWTALQTALADSVKLYNAGVDNTTQDETDASKATLDNAMAGLVEATVASPSKPTTTPTKNPPMGSSTDMIPTLIIMVVALGGIALTIKKTIIRYNVREEI